MPPVFKLLKRSKPVKILPEIEDLHRIKKLQKELARDLDLSRVGEDRPMSFRARHLARLKIEFERRYGHEPDIRKLGK
ncbi:hypothetical protein V5279_37905 [Bradyrhizobium sp. 26S5]|uniref:hypothetical protein n=1 Tax=Bradyrhizobium sp. 26S5 TaxID=3139729 RepID=UPI0030CAA21D